MSNSWRPGWKVDPVAGTFRCEYQDWAALVTPDRYEGHPGWEIAVWLRKYKPDDIESQITRDHMASGESGGLDKRSLVSALQYAEGLLSFKVNGSRS